MQKNQKEVSVKGVVMLFLLVISALTMKEGLIHNIVWYKISFITVPLFLILLVGFIKKA